MPRHAELIAQGLEHYCVLYRDADHDVLANPQHFLCWAEDTDHAEEQMLNFQEDAVVIWTYGTKDDVSDGVLMRRAEADWFNVGEELVL